MRLMEGGGRSVSQCDPKAESRNNTRLEMVSETSRPPKNHGSPEFRRRGGTRFVEVPVKPERDSGKHSVF